MTATERILVALHQRPTKEWTYSELAKAAEVPRTTYQRAIGILHRQGKVSREVIRVSWGKEVRIRLKGNA